MKEIASVLDAAVRLGGILDDLAIPYLVGGSVASSPARKRRAPGARWIKWSALLRRVFLTSSSEEVFARLDGLPFSK